ncbi:YbaK/EbsC family protein [Rarobacter incanus]|uniref:Prolyl-tRNA editing enzyme YbaK/EbsC (Cys-tRNA(Pro) deacylase) n=1 Tax=Rarobacter incanus TaxID=153494 RepID=A0A542SMC1_9MICO|nr:YbaK/EbsC family protein [Rarobacter incanus]TQK75774.1 prolyl-tRNA editing enzyme YbaK/EbsC (Cys-tRNA(Pro) deacylase) [Rarobacter incanus]
MTSSHPHHDAGEVAAPIEPLPGKGLQWLPAIDHPELLAESTHAQLATWAEASPTVAELVRVAAIDPTVSDTAAMSDAYSIEMHLSVNCVLVAGKRDGQERTAAVGVRASTRADINGTIRRLLAVRKASFVPVDRAVSDTSMEYGGITPIGLGPQWPLLLDADIATDPSWVIIGSGVRRSKIALPGRLLLTLPRAHSIAGIGM